MNAPYRHQNGLAIVNFSGALILLVEKNISGTVENKHVSLLIANLSFSAKPKQQRKSNLPEIWFINLVSFEKMSQYQWKYDIIL